AKTFRVRCGVTDPAVSTEGEGASRRLAEQQAAAAALEQLDSK
ncbi:ribonuclease III, partial [Mycobacterium tuberculosis]